MQQLRCTYCGGNLVDQGDWHQCDSCRTKIKKSAMERLSDQDVFDLNAARRFREGYRFQEAQVTYDGILRRNPDCEEAAWGAFLAEYGIEYQVVEQKPTFHALSAEPTYHSRYYAQLSPEHRREADEVIEEKRREILRSVETLPAYDVFLSLKLNDENGEQTPEYEWALQLYYDLREQGYQVFFSPQVLKQSNADWEPYIFRAIQTCRIMLILTSSLEHINAPWVRNEWRRLLSRIANTPEDGSKPTYRVIASDVNCVPPELLSKQVLKHGDYHLRELIEKSVRDACSAKGAGDRQDQAAHNTRRTDEKNATESSEVKRIPMPSGVQMNENYLVVEKMLRDAGFTNIQSFARHDMVGLNRYSWSDGAVVSIKVDGANYRPFGKGRFFSSSVPIYITYHSLPEGTKGRASPFRETFMKQTRQQQRSNAEGTRKEDTARATAQRVCRSRDGKIFIQCPLCGASTPVEDGQERAFCVACGAQLQYEISKVPPTGRAEGATSTQNKSGSKEADQTSGRPINKWIALVLCIFLGLFGAHRFYEGKNGTAVLFLLTRGCFYVGWLVDIIRILKKPNPYYVKAKRQ